jgi:hypothetical protein
MNKSYSLVFSLWDVLKPELANSGVRFDKIKPIDVTWQTDNLKTILNKRIQYFSGGKKSINDIILNENKTRIKGSCFIIEAAIYQKWLELGLFNRK